MRVIGTSLTRCLAQTGQHYDDNMSKLFFEQLGLPKPDAYLGVGSGRTPGKPPES